MDITTVSLRFEVHGECGVLAKCEFFDDALLVAKREDAPYIDDVNRGERYYRRIEAVITYKREE
jgi:hypothetical protein